ncbi:MAG: acyl-CoA dehydrogenase [Actinobacteria bacterium]|nr:acyl-CoA dehydrogenase [Actinomycetota bacterium]
MAAGLLAVGIGATYTLASWTDSEWVWGGAAGNPGVGTSTFNVQQDTTVAFADTGWTDQSTNAGGSLVFTAGALSLTPGDSIYAPVALRASTTSVAGTVSLKAAVAASGVTVNDTGGALWSAIQVEVKTQRTTGGLAPTSACAAGAAGFDNASWGAVAGVSSLASAASATQVLDAAAGSVQHYCFKLTLPAGSPSTLQGRTIAPAWEFSGVSN